MKNFNFNLLQYLNNKKAEKGFTLIELLVVIIIIGILSAIALPAFLNQAAKARQAEAKQALGAINRGQQAYYLENQTFAPSVDTLSLGVPTTTKNFIYGGSATTLATAATAANVGGVGSFSIATGATIKTVALLSANPITPDSVRRYTGASGIYRDSTGNATTTTTLCEETKAATGTQTSPASYVTDATSSDEAFTCKTTYSEL